MLVDLGVNLSSCKRSTHSLGTPSHQDGSKERPAGIHLQLLPSAPAHPTVKKPQILDNFSIPKNKAGVLPTHTSKLSFLSLKQLLPLKAGSLTKSHKWDLLFQHVFQRESTCVHVGGKAIRSHLGTQEKDPHQAHYFKPTLFS